MPNDQPHEPLSIEEVAHPWYVRHRNWLIAGAVAGGLVALGRMRSGTLLSNPLRSKDPKYWLGPMDLGDAPPAPEDFRFPALLEELWDKGKYLHFGISDHTKTDITDTILQFYNALGRPMSVPYDTHIKLTSAIHSLPQTPHWRQNVVNLKWLFEAAQDDPELLRWVWYAIHVPALAALSPKNQQRVFKIIDELPPKQRWRVEWFYRSVPHLFRTTHFPPNAFHPGFINNATRSGYTLEQALALPYKKFLESIVLHEPVEGKPPPENLWLEVHEYSPKKRDLRMLLPRAVVNFPQRDYLRAYRFLEKDKALQEADRIRGAIGLAFIFGPDWKKWLAQMQMRGVDAHDATFWLPQEPAPGLGRFLRRRFLKPATVDSEMVGQMNMIADNWNALPPAVKRDTTKRIIKYITTRRYENIRDEDFAEEAARWGVDVDEYEDMESRFLRATDKKAKTGDTIPSADVVSGDLRLFKLEYDDPRGLFVGRHTACCQAPGLEGESCAWYGVESPDSVFYAVEDPTGAIIAQSWVWRHQDVLVYDNIEGPGIQASATRRQVFDMYRELAKKLLNADPRLREVRIGSTRDRRTPPGIYKMIDWGIESAKNEDIAIVPPPLDYLQEADYPYSDASKKQYVVAKKDTGTKYFRRSEYMAVLAKMLGQVWEGEGPYSVGEDEVKALISLITDNSPFEVAYEIGEPSDEGRSFQFSGMYVYNCFDVPVYLWTSIGGKYAKAPAFTVQVCLEGNFRDLSLRKFKQRIDVLARSQHQQTVLNALKINLDDDTYSFDLEPDLPSEVSYNYARYAVLIEEPFSGMEEFRFYRTLEDAQKIAGVLQGVSEGYHNYDAIIQVLRELSDEEIEQFEAGELEYEEDDCHQIRPDEWWCVE